MRIFSTAVLSAVFLGAATSDGWCPQPSSNTAPLGSSTGASAVSVGPGRNQDFMQMKRKLEDQNMRQGTAPKAEPKISGSTAVKKPANVPQTTWDKNQAIKTPSPNNNSGASAMDRLQ